MSRLRLAAQLGSLLSALLLSACGAPPSGGQARADAATRAACQQRAEQTYELRNRADIYSPQSQVNTPFSGNDNSGIADRGLSELFVHDKMVSDCVRNTGTGDIASPPGAPAKP